MMPRPLVAKAADPASFAGWLVSIWLISFTKCPRARDADGGAAASVIAAPPVTINWGDRALVAISATQTRDRPGDHDVSAAAAAAVLDYCRYC
jgi:hypothetical protein